MANPSTQADAPGPPKLWHLCAVLLAGVMVYIPGLGRHGLSATEGHRAIPGWEMLESGNWWLPTMFGQAYLRKPPGMPWAVSLSSMLFGMTEFAARMVSAVATIGLSLVIATFAARWFGRRYGLAAGLAAVLTPLFWDPGRTAEIEALNNFAAASAVLLLLDLLLFDRQKLARAGLHRQIGAGVLAGLAICLAGLVKGPAAMPAIGAAVVAACAVQRSTRALWAPGLWTAILLSGAILTGVLLKVRAEVEASGQTPVLQGVSDFLWTGRPFTLESAGEVAIMPLLGLLSIFPWCLAMLFPWGPDARSEAARGEIESASWKMARAVTLTAVLSIVLLAVMGVRNPRYAQPCVAFVPVIVAYFLRGWDRDFFLLRGRIAAAFSLGHPAIALLVLAVACGLVVQDPFGMRERTSGRTAGQQIGAAMDSAGEIWADHIVEARPETLWYAAQTAERAGVHVVPKWKPGLGSAPCLPAAGGYLLLRQDLESDEVEAFRRAGLMADLRPVVHGSVHKFGFVLYRVTASP